MKTRHTFEYERYASLAELPEADRLLVDEAQRATELAHAPYSHFCVGAAVRLRSGRVLHGSNVESEVFPAGLC
ncbi:MAG: cytidine deaminase, partial [Alistipes sp.]|nr:cytidine deaminase [Alistipes sp.]